MEHIWDMETDIIVVGFGFGGGAAALSAHDRGAKVMILEKMKFPGGLSITSGGGVAVAYDREKAFQCLKAFCADRTPDDVIRVFADGLCDLQAWLETLAAEVGMELEIDTKYRSTSGYPLPGTEAIGAIKIAPLEGFSTFPWARGLRGGARLFKVILDHVNKRPGIQVRYQTAAQRLIREGGEIIGVEACDDHGRKLNIRANRAVILATGGFEFNEEMKKQYFQASPVYGVTAVGNTGDGIRMAQEVGANLWHMWHFHGSYGFKFPEFPFAFRHRFAGYRDESKIMPWMVVDRLGRRFMNEYHPCPNDTNARPLDQFDPELVTFPRIPCFLIFDEQGRKQGPIGAPIVTTEEDEYYAWSQDNMAEIERGWIFKADSLAGLRHQINTSSSGMIPEGALEESVNRWNRHIENGVDSDFFRPVSTMLPITEPPFYALPAWPIVSNTQGGPVHNANQQVLDVWNRPIPRLYAVGELGSLFGYLYLLSANISECFIGGRIAGEHAAAVPPREAE